MILIEPTIKSDFNFAEVITDITCAYFQTNLEIITQDRSKGRYSQARNFCIHFVRLYTNLTWVEMSDIFDRTPPTMLGNYNHIRGRLLMKDRRMYSKYMDVKHRIDMYLESIYPLTWLERKAYVAEARLTIVA